MAPPLHLLYAEDNPVDADLTLSHFERFAPDLRLEILESGEPCEARLAAEPFDLLLLDNHLPDIDGIEVLTRIRAAGHRLPVVMLTGAGDGDTVARALVAGADDYVTKAGDYLTRLPDLLRELTERVRGRASLEAEAGRRVKRLLYVEPSSSDAAATVDHFAAAAPHLQIEVARTCEAALARLEKDPDFDLVMSDLRLPDMNAFDFFHDLRRRAVNLPFVVITADGDEQSAVALLRLGASDYIVKRDHYLTQLPHSIEHALHRFRLDRSLERLRGDLESLNRTLEQRVEDRTAELSREVQERLRAEEDVRQSSERYFRALENMLEGCQILSPEMRYLYVNEAAARHGRKRRPELIGRTMPEVYPGVEATPLFAALKRCLTERIPIQMDNRFVYPDGAVAWFELSIQPVPEGIFVLSMDITEKKRAETELRESKDDLAVTLESIGDAVIATDDAGRVTRMNRTAERLTGWPLRDAEGHSLEEVFRIVNAESREAVADPVRKVLEEGRVIGLANHTTLLSRDGREYQIANAGSPIRGADGKIRGVVLVFKDVTEEYRVQQMVRDREEQLSLIANALPGPVSRIAADGTYLFANLACADWFGATPGDIVGRPREQVLGTARTQYSRPYIERVAAGERLTYEASVPTPSGQRHALVTLIPDPDRGGNPGGHISVVTDITERRNAEEKLQKREALLRIAGRTAGLGGWAIDLATLTITWTDEVCALFEVPPGFSPDAKAGLEWFPPEWRETARTTAMACALDGRSFDTEIEIVTAAGRRRWVRATGEAERDASQTIVRVHGAVQNIDEKKRSERRIQEQLDELRRWQYAMVNRESRAQELKAEVNELRRQLGFPPRYGGGEP